MKKLIIISGPTASGKTKTSIDTASFIKHELKQKVCVVNFDSLLFYKEISIGTAKPTIEEQKDIEHFMVGITSISNPMNAADFIKIGEEKLNELFDQNYTCILTGGSAFYLRALLKGMYESPTTPESIRQKVDLLYKNEGIDPFIKYLKINDPLSLVNYHTNDHYRIMRACEHHMSTGDQISVQKKILDDLNPYDFTSVDKPWDILHIYLDLPKDEHFEIITKRTKQMFNDGLLLEVENLKEHGFTLEEKPLSSIGYKEVIDYKNGLFKTLEECMERISISTRQLAKSQRTFFNKIVPKLNFNPLHDQEKILDAVKSFLKG